MKKVVFALFCAFVFSFVGHGSAYAGKYIKELAVASESTEAKAKQKLTSQEYTVLDLDMNRKAGGKYVYLGYKTTDDFTEAITALIVFDGEKYNGSGDNVKESVKFVNGLDAVSGGLTNSWDFHPITRLSGNGDLNQDAGGNYLYLYYSKSNQSRGRCISTLEVSCNSKKNWLNGVCFYNGFYNTELAELNKKAGGSDVYLWYSTTTYDAKSSALDDKFEVIHHGGRLYQFNLPVATKADGITNVFAKGNGTSNCGWISYVDSLNTTHNICYIDHINSKSNNYNFAEAWTASVHHNIFDSGDLVNYEDFSKTSDEATYTCSGNKRDYKYISILWMAPAGWDPAYAKTFKMWNDNAYSGNNILKVKKEVSARSSYVPSGMNMVNVSDPFIYIDGDSPGWQQTMVNTMQNMYKLAIWDGEKFVVQQIDEGGTTSATPLIESCDSSRTMVAMIYMNQVSMDTSSGAQDTTLAVVGVPFEMKAFHSIAKQDTKCITEKIDSVSGIYTFSPYLSWAISNPDDEDLMSSDQFVLYRSETPDFADLNVVDSKSVDEFEIYSDNKKLGWFTTIDSSPEALTTSVEAEGDTCLFEGGEPVEGELKECISDLKLWVASSKQLAFNNLNNEGYPNCLLLNDNYMPGMVLAMGYKTSTNLEDAITDIKVYSPSSFGAPNPAGWTTVNIQGHGGRDGNLTSENQNRLIYTKAKTKQPYGTSGETEFLALAGMELSDVENDADNVSFTYTIPSYYNFNFSQTPKRYLKLAKRHTRFKCDLTPLQKYRIPKRYMYYLATRAVVHSYWGRTDKFEAQWQVPLTTTLPTVTEVRADSSLTYSKDNKVTITVRLANPYPWEMGDKYEIEALKKYAEQINLTHRLFTWDTNANIIIHRYSPQTDHYEGEDEAETTFTIAGKDVKWDAEGGYYYAQFNDRQTLPYTSYYYEAKVDAENSAYPTCVGMNEYVGIPQSDVYRYESLSSLYDVKASAGEYPGKVVVTWDVNEGICDSVVVTRKDTKEIVPLASSGSAVEDARPGDLHEYTLTSYGSYRGKTYTTTATVAGASGYYGSIEGKVQMGNGAGMPAKLKVRLTRDSGLSVPDVKYKGNILLKGYSDNGFERLYDVNEDGTYLLDSIPFSSQASEYKLEVEGTSASLINYAGVKGAASVTVSSAHPQYTNVDFTCNDTVRITGNVYFEGSTVPSRYVEFLVNGTTVTDANGNPIQTDQTGAFSFSVPRGIETTIQAVRKNHTFKDGGYVKGGDKADQIKFTPLKSYSGLTLWDQTTVRLVGRLAGGDVEGSKPLGMGLSHNNLGANLYMVMSLEGDNTSWLVYNREDPDNTDRDAFYCQTVAVEGADTLTIDTTYVAYHKKRVEIWPDIKTGEFAIDLFPTKYKITALSANGYASLFTEGEGFQVLDLTNAADTLISLSATKLVDEKKNILEYRSTTCQAQYTKIYHNTATVHFQQYDSNGMLVDYFGEKTIKQSSLYDGYTYTIPLYSDGKPIFDYPVFSSMPSNSVISSGGKEYKFKVSVSEDYYYNNDFATKAESVPVPGCTLTVYNGMDSATKFSPTPMDENGECVVTINVNNPTYTILPEGATRTLVMQAEKDGYYYSSDTLKAYVLGVKTEGEDLIELSDGQVKVVDIVRDPYGTNSYAYRSEGTTYNWSYNYADVDAQTLQISLSAGPYVKWYIGQFVATGSEIKGSATGSVSIPIKNTTTKKTASYSMTLSEKIATSSSTYDEGAMSDVYIGYTNSTVITKNRAFTIIDSLLFADMQPAIASGDLKVVTKCSRGNSVYYIVIGDALAVSPYNVSSTFAYSQKHILGTLIPNMRTQLEQMVLDCDSLSAQQMANTTNHITYYYKERKGGNIEDDVIAFCSPQTDQTEVLSALQLQQSINSWKQVVRDNENTKVSYLREGSGRTPYKSYSIAGSKITYTESASSYYIDQTVEGSKRVSGSVGGGVNGQTGKSSEQLYNTGTQQQPNWQNKANAQAAAWEAVKAIHQGEAGYEGNLQQALADNALRDQINTQLERYATKRAFKNPGGAESSFAAAGVHGSFTLSYSFNESSTTTASSYEVHATGSGYELSINDNGYALIDVYRVAAQNDNLAAEWTYIEGLDKKSDIISQAANICTHDYIFYPRAGARRNPWLAPDSTQIYIDPATKRPFPLSAQMLKIDNPKITVANPVVSNVPKSEKAIFSVSLANETEVSENITDISPSSFTLRLDPKSNPLGAKIYIDGQPLVSSLSLTLAPGKTITKTIEVEKGTGYDFDNLTLLFAQGSLTDKAAISVHFLPESTPLTLVTPTDKWVMNTLSNHDDQGYYIPIQVSGYDINYENFDHIELQYKKSTQGESQWVNLCSYYANDSLYRAATGVKDSITSGTIRNYRFYGETDPMEMNYDLRAVSFCRLGTGYVTASSNIASGLKDTRRPEVFGKPKPVSGVLTPEDVISLPFSEPIAYNYLNKTANFQVQGYTNNYTMDYSTALQFSGNDYSYATTQVKRNLTNRSFTVDMMIRMDENVTDEQTFMAIEPSGEDYEGMSFGYSPRYDRLILAADKEKVGVFYSEPLKTNSLSLKGAMTHVGFAYNCSDSTVVFFVGDKTLKSSPAQTVIGNGESNHKPIISAYGPIIFGKGFSGKMADVRLWGKVLNSYEIANKYGKRLSDNEKGLIAYWPMTEGMGITASDEVNGADLTFVGAQWSVPSGYSLRLDGKPIRLTYSKNTEYAKFQRDSTADYTLSFWLYTRGVENQPTGVFAFGSSDLAEIGYNKFWIGYKDGNLIWSTKGNDHEIASSEKLSNEWHQVTVTVNHSQNTAAIYLDSKCVDEFRAEEAEGLNTDLVLLGGEGFYGNIDQVAFFHKALPATYISKYFGLALTGKEMDLQIYLPFERDIQNDQSTMYVGFSPYNMVYTSAGTTAIYDMFDDVPANMQDNSWYAPVMSNAGISNLDFTWTSTDNELQINLNESAKDINHRLVNITVRGVEDNAGNTMEQSQMWTVYIDQNLLVWDERHLDITVNYLQPATFTASWHNKSAKTISYNIEKYCHWLTIYDTIGSTQSLSDGTVEMTVLEGLAPGQYSTTVYLEDETGLVSPLIINLTVEAQQPDWVQTTDKQYNQSMNIIGQVYTRDQYGTEIVANDPKDFVGVFYNGVCLGTAHIEQDGTIGKGADSNVYLNIRGNADIEGKLLEFRLWEAHSGTISILIPDTIPFRNNTLLGHTSDEIVKFHKSDYGIQEIELAQGWNWVSLHLDPLAADATMLFQDTSDFSDGDVIKVINKGFGTFNEEKQIWTGSSVSKIPVSHLNIYHIYRSVAGKVKVSGKTLSDDQLSVHISKNGWSELPYLLETSLPITDALADYPFPYQSSESKAKVGDYVKSHDQFAVATTDGWVGSLKTMQPGVGYYLYHSGDECEISYKGAESKEQSAEVSAESKDHSAGLLSTRSETSQNMPVIAALKDSAIYVDGDVVMAVTNDMCAGSAELSTLKSGEGRFFISVNAENNNKIRFALVRNGKIVGITDTYINYNGNETVGTLSHPHLIDFTPADDTIYYDLSGRLISTSQTPQTFQTPQIVISKGKKQLIK